MKKVLSIGLIVFTILVLGAGTSHALMLNFNDLESTGNSITLIPSYSNSGFDLTSSVVSTGAFASGQQNNGLGLYLGSASLHNNFHSGMTTLSSSGSLFSLNSIDLSQYPGTAFTRTIPFMAYDGASSLVDTYYATLPNLLYPTPVPPYWITFNLPSTFQNVASVQWTQVSFGTVYTFDNINLSGGSGSGVIPEPASMLLMGMGLMGAGAFKRRKK